MKLSPRPTQSLLVFEIARLGGKTQCRHYKGQALQIRGVPTRSRVQMVSTIMGLRRRHLAVTRFENDSIVEIILTDAGKRWAEAWDEEDHFKMGNIANEWRNPKMVYLAGKNK